MIRNTLSKAVTGTALVVMLGLGLLPQAALAHDGPYICADEAVPGSCVPAYSHQLAQERRMELTAGIEGIGLPARDAATAHADAAPPPNPLPGTGGYGPARTAE